MDGSLAGPEVPLARNYTLRVLRRKQRHRRMPERRVMRTSLRRCYHHGAGYHSSTALW
ncbi:hypothetical protein [Thermobaculum terrenum]|uniref:hypothetical protein n=1 Tax=Thermobaculum terrenum TaxID=166501 RepID=UPI00145FA563|nr:hypothetical protein [Thermobaculum terrenum]